jgi:hypothetical protein
MNELKQLSLQDLIAMKSISKEKKLIWIGTGNIEFAKKHRSVTLAIQEEIDERYNKVFNAVHKKTV